MVEINEKPHSRTLLIRTRIRIAIILLIFSGVSLFMMLSSIGERILEYHAFTMILEKDTDLITSTIDQGTVPVLLGGRELYSYNENGVGQLEVPQQFRYLQLGFHDIREGPIVEWMVNVFKYNSMIYVLVIDKTEYNELNGQIHIVLFITLMASACLAIWLGLSFVDRIVKPITKLYEAIKKEESNLPYQNYDDEIGLLARAFAARSSQLENYLWRERCFTGDASHELRTPLAIIHGAAEIIRHKLNPAERKLHAVTDRIIQTVEEMDEQLTTLLLLARTPETINFQACQLDPIIGRCIKRCNLFLKHENVELQYVKMHDAYAIGRPELIYSVFFNLLRNACQYTNQGYVRIELDSTSIKIIDTGIGLPEPLDLKSQKRFAHGPSSTGEGLGLSIAQRIISHLGWSLEIDSSPAGCCFYIKFA